MHGVCITYISMFVQALFHFPVCFAKCLWPLLSGIANCAFLLSLGCSSLPSFLNHLWVYSDLCIKTSSSLMRACSLPSSQEDQRFTQSFMVLLVYTFSCITNQNDFTGHTAIDIYIYIYIYI